MFSLLILIPFLAAINIVLAENIVEVELINPSPHTIVDPYEDIYVETYIHNCNESLCGDKFRMIYQFYDTENDFGINDYSWPEYHGICLNYSCSHTLKLDAELIAKHDSGFVIEVFVEPISYYDESIDLSRAYTTDEFYNQFGGVQLNYEFRDQFRCDETYYNAKYIFEKAYLNPWIWSFEQPEHNSVYSIGDNLPIYFAMSGALRDRYKTLDVFSVGVVKINNGEETLIKQYPFGNNTSEKYNTYYISISDTIFKPDCEYYLTTNILSNYFNFTSGIFKISPSKNITIDTPIIEDNKINIVWNYDFEIESDYKYESLDVQLMHKDQLFTEVLIDKCRYTTIYDTTCQIDVPLNINFVGGFYIKIGYYNQQGIYKQYYSDEFSIDNFKSVLKGIYKSSPIKKIKPTFELLPFDKSELIVNKVDEPHSVLKSGSSFIYQFVPDKYYGTAKIELRYYFPLVGSRELSDIKISPRNYKQVENYPLNFGVIEKTNIFQKFLRLYYKCKVFGYACSPKNVDINVLPYQTSFSFNFDDGIINNEIELFNRSLEYETFSGSVHFGLKDTYVNVPISINNLYVHLEKGKGIVTKYDVDFDFTYSVGLYAKLFGEYNSNFNKPLISRSIPKLLSIPINLITVTIGIDFSIDFNLAIEMMGMFEYSIQYSKKYTYSLKVDTSNESGSTKSFIDLTPNSNIVGEYKGEINVLFSPSFDINLGLTFGVFGYNPLKIPFVATPGLDFVIETRVPPYKHSNGYYYYVIYTPSYWLNFKVFNKEFELIEPTEIGTYCVVKSEKYNDFEIEFDVEKNPYENADEIELKHLCQNFYILIMWLLDGKIIRKYSYQSVNDLNVRIVLGDNKLLLLINTKYDLDLESAKYFFKALIDDRILGINKYKTLLEEYAYGFNVLAQRYADYGYKFYPTGSQITTESSSQPVVESSSQITTETNNEIDKGLIIGLTIGLTSLIAILCIILIIIFTCKHKKCDRRKYPYDIEMTSDNYSIQIASYDSDL